MDSKEHKYFSWCVNNGITIYPVPIARDGSVLKIAINFNGQEKIGEEKFVDNTFKDNKIYKKIDELYKTIFQKHNKHEE